MNILFTLCGRAGSKGVKGKNIRGFCGVPLVWYTLAAIAICKEQYPSIFEGAQVVLNTDSDELVQLVKMQNEIKVQVINREVVLAGDNVPKVSVIKDCLERMEAFSGTSFEVVVDLDITSPLRTAEDICRAVQKKIENANTDVVYSVTPSRRNPYFNMVKKENDYYIKAIKSEYTARQQAPAFFDMNASIYAYSPKALRNKAAATFFNDYADVIIMRESGILDIDSEEDYQLMQVIAKYFYQNDDNYRVIRQRALAWKNCRQEHQV